MKHQNLTRHSVLILFLSSTAFASAPVLIPRSPTPIYRSDVFFEGGSDSPASLEGLRMATHNQYERWVIDFADDKTQQKTDIAQQQPKHYQKTAPKFQVRYLPAEKTVTDTGERVLGRPAKLIVTIHKVKHNSLTKERLRQLVRQSEHVRDITIYPPIEDGDTAMEFIFSSEAPVNIHQPLEKEGRLVIDIARRTLK